MIIIIKIFQNIHGIFRGVREGRQRGSRADNAEIPGRAMPCISFDRVAGGKPPTVFAVTLVAFRIFYAVLTIDQHMVEIMLPVIGIFVFEAMGIEAKVGIVLPEKRATEFFGAIVLKR